VRPGTLAIVAGLLIAILVFGYFLITYDNDDGRPEGRPSPTVSSA
jgi:hypothetical protein